MSNETPYPVDPMSAFYAAITSVENGSVGEVELEFIKTTAETEITLTMTIRREVRPFAPINQKELGE